MKIRLLKMMIFCDRTSYISELTTEMEGIESVNNDIPHEEQLFVTVDDHGKLGVY